MFIFKFINIVFSIIMEILDSLNHLLMVLGDKRHDKVKFLLFGRSESPKTGHIFFLIFAPICTLTFVPN